MRIFDDLLLHDRTRTQLLEIAGLPSQGYLFVAPAGSGKKNVAARLAQHWTNSSVGYVHIIEPNGTSIGIEQIHSLRPLLAQRVADGARRAVIVDQAAKLTLEAQNSLLKALEEPRERTTFVLLTDDAAQLLPTVRSRLIEINFSSVDQDKLLKWATDRFAISTEEARRAYHIGGATPGGIAKLMDESSSVTERLESAKRFLQADPYTRIEIVSTVQGQERQEIREFIMMLARLISAALNNLRAETDRRAYKKMGEKLQLVLQSASAVDQYANPRLVLSRLVLEL